MAAVSAEQKKRQDELQKLFDSGVLLTASDARLQIKRFSSGVPQLDAILGGGYVFGRNILCVGPESAGKTLLAQYAAAEIQKLDPSNKVLLVDAEFSYIPEWWAQAGVDPERMLVTQPPHGEAAVDTIMTVCFADPSVKFVVVDSLATLNPAPVVEKAAGEHTVAPLARLLVSLYGKIPQLLARGVTMFAINQLRTPIQGYDDVFPGGREQRHNSHVILKLRRDEWIKEGNDRVGYWMEVLAQKTKIGGHQQDSVRIPVRFGSQIDLVSSYLEEAIERQIIATAGPYYSMTIDGQVQKWLGKSALRDALTNPALFGALKAALA